MIGEKTANIAPQSNLANPFPGLRPFRLQENSLFFGREEQTDALLEQLSSNRFVAVIGSSGSGKSSLVRAGLIPLLQGGFMTEVGSHWRVVITRPGGGPIDNLAAALNKDQNISEKDPDTRNFQTGLTRALLRTSSMGLVEVIENQKKPRESTLILVDQFEELFRYRDQAAGHESINESIAFVNLLLEAVRNRRAPIFVLLTMRSDFLGECAQFRALTKAINESHYLIPRMSRAQLKDVIEGPVNVGGGSITPRLVQRLLNEVGDKPDQLTVLQHALMRTWQYWTRVGRKDEPIDIQHYEAVGTMASALSRHADEAYFELEGERLPLICEKLFKAITEKTRENSAIRRPARLKEICDITGGSRSEVMEVVEKFRMAERSLLMPPPNQPLTDESIIDISHESLIWIWDRLRNWVEEETQSAQMYLRLSEAAEMYQSGQTRTWRPPDLHLATNWKQSEAPTLSWARRYNPAFERTMNFLDYSEEVYKQEVEREEKRRRREIRRVRVTAIILGIASVVSVLFLFFSILANIEAQNQRKKAEEQTERAIANQDEAECQRQLAQEQANEANRQKQFAQENENEALRQQKLALESRAQALVQKNLAELNEQEALKQKTIAQQQTQLALSSEKEALYQEELAKKSRNEAERLRLLSAARAMAIKSKEVPDGQLKGLLAYQAYQFSRQNGGKKHDPDLYGGLLSAMKAFNGADFNALSEHSDGIRSLAWSATGNYLATAGSDGKVNVWEKAKAKPTGNYSQPGTIYRSIDFSPDEKKIVVAGGNTAQIIDRKLPAVVPPFNLKGHTGEIRFARYSPKGTFIATGSADSTIRIWNAKDYSLENLYPFKSPIRDLAIDPEEKYLIAITGDGGLHIQNFQSGNTTRLKYMTGNEKGMAPARVKIDPEGKWVAIGTDLGRVVLVNLTTGNLEFEFIGHTAEISSLDFNKTTPYLVSSSLDGSVRVWNLAAMNDQPLLLDDHRAWVWQACFSPDGKVLATGTKDGKLRQWPINPEDMAMQMCYYLSRNFTEKEWEVFVGEGIPYQKTCLEPGQK
ncbi:MAG: hypothetical protein H6581_13695 [Bacteroidia bacterium]|nr:hypothetical protein [Bacteroidia bacterium]